MQHFSYAFSKWTASWSFIFRNKLGHFFIYPVVITILLNILAFKAIRHLADQSLILVEQWLGKPEGGVFDSFADFFTHLASNITVALTWILGVFIFYKISKYVTLAVMSPVMSILAVKTEEIITGRKTPFDPVQFFRDIIRGMAISLRNLVMELFFLGALFFVNIIIAIFFAPADLIVTPVSTFLSFVISAYYSGFSTMDYALENRKYSLNKSVAFMRKNPGLAIGNGMMYTLLFRIPFIGVAIAAITSTVSGTLIICEEKYNKV